MTRDGSRPQRFAKIWLGPSLATLVVISSTDEPAARPIPAARVEVPGPILIQQAPGPQGDAQEPGGAPRAPSAIRDFDQQILDLLQQPGGTPRAPSADESKPDPFLELHEALTAARERVSELSRAAQEAAAAGQLRQEVAALREENQQLRAELDAMQAERGDLETARQAAEAHSAKLTKTLNEATAEARELEQQLVAVRSQSEQRIAAANATRIKVEARLSEMRDSLQRAEQEKARIGAELAKVQRESASTKEQLAGAGQEQAQSEQRVAALEDERDDLRTRLADATARLGRSEAAKIQLESEVAELRETARTAAADTRRLIEALAAIGFAAGPLETDAALLAESGAPSVGEEANREGRAVADEVAAVAAPSQGPEPTSADADLQRTRTASATRPGDREGAHLDQRGILGGRPAVFPTLANLPPERRQHVQGLLADLPSKLEERGLMTTMPGELLFTTGSDQVQAGAYDTLAKVAELIGMYPNRQVLIVGHSDARGDAERNRYLSERRAERVKEIFVNDFDIAADRLSTEGLGDARPIASNATPQGRRVNRRVEVLILN
jgi:chemotaxis protein MotB